VSSRSPATEIERWLADGGAVIDEQGLVYARTNGADHQE
jgi:hypothetical protein